MIKLFNMKRKKFRNLGLSLTEVMLAVAMVTTCMIAVGGIFFDSHKAWTETYGRAYTGIMLESNQAAKAFEAAVRKASCEKYLLDNSGRWVEVYYFNSAASAKVDRYARLYVENGTFKIEYGSIDPRQPIDIISVCSNVTAFTFSGMGHCIRMQMTLSDNDYDVSFVASAVPQNQ
jgi:hypothetical protein